MVKSTPVTTIEVAMNKLISQYSGLKKEIYVLFVGKTVTAMGSFVWPMLTFFLTTKLGLSDGQATFFIALATTVSLPASLLGGKIADKFSRKKVIILFDCLTVSLYVLAAIVPIGIHTAVMVFLAGLFQTIEGPAYDALNADFSTTEQRERAFSLSYLGFNLGFVVGASVSGILFARHTNLAFLLNGVAIFTSTVLIWIFVHMENAVGAGESTEESYGIYEQPVDEHTPVLQVLKERRAVLYVLLIGCIASMANNVTGIILPLQLKERLGVEGATIYGYLNSLNGFTVIVFTPILTVLLKKITEIPKTLAGHSLFLMGMVFYSFDPAIWLLFVGMFIYTLGEVVTVLGSNPYSSRRIPASHRGRVGGISSVVYSAFQSLTQFGISAVLTLTDNNYRLLWLSFIGIGVVACVLYALVYKMDKRMFPVLYKT